MTGTILCVCTGNLCRSPLLAQVLRTALGPEVRVVSAGTDAAVGGSVPEATTRAALALGFGAGLPEHRPRPLDRELVDSADLVVALAREHRGAVARLSPRASRRTFTLLELGRLAGVMTDRDRSALHERIEDGQAPLAALAVTLAALRGHAAPPASPVDLDVVDPFGAGDGVHAAAAREIVRGGRQLLEVLDDVAGACSVAA